jgi:lysozyme family protein
MPLLTADQRFNRCAALVTAKTIEGGFVNDPKDPGGATNFGITLATLEHWRGVPCSVEDVKELTQAEADVIYRALYWRVVSGDDLPAGIDLIVFDAAVNQGPGTAAGFLQRAAKVSVDRNIGPATLAAVRAANQPILITDYAAERMAEYQQDTGWEHDGRGWSNRVMAIKAQAIAWARALI